MKLFIILFILLIILFCLQYKTKITEKLSNNINLGLWCEYPEMKGMNMDTYFTTLLNFINKHNITKLVFRVMNPCVFTIYNLKSGSFFKYMKQLPSSVKLWMLPYIANDGHWTSDWNIPSVTKTSSPNAIINSSTTSSTTSFCCSCQSGCCTSKSQMQQINCSCSCDFSKVMYWISQASLQIPIEGIVYEPEGSCLTGNTNSKLTEALKILSSEKVKYSNLTNLKFGWTGAWTAKPENGWDETFPQWYNLTKKTTMNTLVDAYSGNWNTKMLPPSPEFPNTIYGKCLTKTTYQKNTPQDVLNKMLSIAPTNTIYNNYRYGKTYYINSSSNILNAVSQQTLITGTYTNANYNAMFSVESGPNNLTSDTLHSNCWYNTKKAKTITGLTYDNYPKKNGLGTINAFGSFDWTFNDFYQFITLFSQKYNVNDIMIFQFNYIPSSWI